MSLFDPIVLGLNQVAARVAIRAPLVDRILSIQCYEVGVDGTKPGSPVAVAGPDQTLRIGTPFLWTPDTRPLYAVMVAGEVKGTTKHWEIQFGFTAAGNIEITSGPRETSVRPVAIDPELPSLFIVGDSTAYSNGPNQRGWGDELGHFFDPSKVNVLNRARPGRSTRSFRSEGLWDRVLEEMKAGDVVAIQFGHNDADSLDQGRCRGVLPGIGAETCVVSLPDGTTETVHTFGGYLRQFVGETKARGATPILLSLTAKNLWRGGRLVFPQSDHGAWSARVAAECGLAFIDLTESAARRYEALEPERVQALFCSEKDPVHTSPAGAKLNARLVAEAIGGWTSHPLADGLRRVGVPSAAAKAPR